MEINRRDFLRQMAALGLTAASASALWNLLSCTPLDEVDNVTHLGTPSQNTSSLPVSVAPSPTGNYLSVARGDNPGAITEAAIKSLGGMERFVKPGYDVIIKPNICVSYHTYEYAATTNPEVVGKLVELCKGAGAKRVRVMDSPFGGTAKEAYAKSGIESAVNMAGGQMELMTTLKYQNVVIPEGKDIKRWLIYTDVLKADVIINVPIAKHHNLARLTLGMKNLLGVIQNRQQIHFNIGQRIADLNSIIRPQLTVIDAVRSLMKNGPTGGNLDDVKMNNTVIASHDVVAADTYAAGLFGLTGSDISYIKAGAEMGLGTMGLKDIKIEEISV